MNLNNLLNTSQSNSMLKSNLGLAGPNLKCIGAAYTEDKAENDLARDIPVLRKAAETVLNVDISYFAKAVNNWIDLFYNTQTANRTWLKYSLNQPPLGCTRDGLILLINTLDSTKREILASMKKEAIKKGGQLFLDRTEPVEYNVSGGNNLMHPGVERFAILIEKKPEPVSEIINEPSTSTQPIAIEVNNTPEVPVENQIPDSNSMIKKIELVITTFTVMKRLLLFSLIGLTVCAINAQTINKKRVEKVRNSVVRIIVDNSSSGTGFFVSPNGLMITNNHVIQPAFIRDPQTNLITGVKKIMIEFNNGELLEMGVVDSFLNDSYVTGLVGDFILLAPNTQTNKKFDYLLLGKWADVHDGDFVYTAGFPFSVKQQIITTGLFSTKFENIIKVENNGKSDFVKRKAAWLDMTLNAGNSGGPVIVMKGNQKRDRVIGIASFNLNPYAEQSKNLAYLFREATKALDPKLMNADKAVSLLFQSTAQNSMGISGAVNLDYIYLRLRQQNLIQQQKKLIEKF